MFIPSDSNIFHKRSDAMAVRRLILPRGVVYMVPRLWEDRVLVPKAGRHLIPLEIERIAKPDH